MYHGQGQHSIKVGDIDGDGFDEILNGSIAIDNDGRTMWSTGLGHGDRFYLSDIDPERPGLEVWYTIEDPHPQNGVSLWDARHGTLALRHRWSRTSTTRSPAALPGTSIRRIPAWKCGATSTSSRASGKAIEGPVPPQNELVWWDADLLRELHTIAERSRSGRGQVGRTEGSVQHVADLARRLARGDRHVRERRAAHLQDDDPGQLTGASR